MINHPVIYHRDFRNDLPPRKPEDDGLLEKCKKTALSAIPILSLHRTFRGPLSLTMSGLRTVTQSMETVENFKRGDINEGAFHLLHASLAAAAVGFFFFNPVYCFLASSVSDLIINSRSFIENAKSGNTREMLESLAFLTLDLHFLVSICYGAIEITVVCMLLQILIDFYLSAGHFQKGEYMEGMCQAFMAGAHMKQAIPQIKLLKWKCKYNPILTAELKRDSKGFVYLDIPDEYLHSLIQLCDDLNVELPPYFGRDRAGAHVTVILSDEMRQRNGIRIDDIGKKFSFRIVNLDAVKPDGMQGIDKVYFVTLSSPELEALRARYGFSPKIDNHDFHLTYGIRKNT